MERQLVPLSGDPEDALTNLPWSAALYDEAAEWITAQDLHAVCIVLAGLADVTAQYGEASAQLMLREVAHRVNRLMTTRDRLARHADNTMLIFTLRGPEEIENLLQQIRQQLETVAVDLHGTGLLRPQTGVAMGARVADPAQARGTIEALVISAASAAAGVPQDLPVEVSPVQHHEEAPAPQPSHLQPASYVPPSEEAAPGRLALIQDRMVLEAVQLNLSGQVATAVVRLREGDRRVSGRSVDRNVEERRLRLIGDAAARALTELLPIGYGALLQDIQTVSTQIGDAVVAAVLLLAPDGEQMLMGVARTEAGVAEASARSVLDAVNRRLALMFADAPLISSN